MIITAEEAEEQAILSTAKQMMAAIHTAPKGCGMDKVKTIALTGSDKDCLADEMMKINAETGLEFFKRDSENVRNSALVILVGVPDSPLGMPHCGICGFTDCAANRVAGGRCIFTSADLGIALGSAVSLASSQDIDSRIFYSIGKAAMRLHSLGDKVTNIFGIALSVSSKNIFFDRGPRKIMQ